MGKLSDEINRIVVAYGGDPKDSQTTHQSLKHLITSMGGIPPKSDDAGVLLHQVANLVELNEGVLVRYQEFNVEPVTENIYFAKLDAEPWYADYCPEIMVDYDGTSYQASLNAEDHTYGAESPSDISTSEYPFCIMINGSDVEFYTSEDGTHTVEVYVETDEGGGETEFVSVLLQKDALIPGTSSIFVLAYSELHGEYTYSPFNLAAAPTSDSFRVYVPFVNGVGTVVIACDDKDNYTFECHDSYNATSLYNCPTGIYIFTVQAPDGYVGVNGSK